MNESNIQPEVYELMPMTAESIEKLNAIWEKIPERPSTTDITIAFINTCVHVPSLIIDGLREFNGILIIYALDYIRTGKG